MRFPEYLILLGWLRKQRGVSYRKEPVPTLIFSGIQTEIHEWFVVIKKAHQSKSVLLFFPRRRWWGRKDGAKLEAP